LPLKQFEASIWEYWSRSESETNEELHSSSPSESIPTKCPADCPSDVLYLWIKEISNLTWMWFRAGQEIGHLGLNSKKKCQSENNTCSRFEGTQQNTQISEMSQHGACSRFETCHSLQSMASLLGAQQILNRGQDNPVLKSLLFLENRLF
jgi:hypothetical protein